MGEGTALERAGERHGGALTLDAHLGMTHTPACWRCSRLEKTRHGSGKLRAMMQHTNPLPSSEELQQRSPKTLGRFLYYGLGASTLQQLKRGKIIRSTFSSHIAQKKPDGLVVLAGGRVKAVIEYKPPKEIRTEKQIQAAINQELEVAKELCNLLVVTSGRKTVWVNANSGNRILDSDNRPLSKTFDVMPIENGTISDEDAADLEQLIDRIDQSIDESNDIIQPIKPLDPSALARTLWQKIWINTGKEPERCLYNVVELFMFKFLSDVGVLKDYANFHSVHRLVQEKENEML